MNTFDIIILVISAITLFFFLKAALKDLSVNMHALEKKRQITIKKVEEKRAKQTQRERRLTMHGSHRH